MIVLDTVDQLNDHVGKVIGRSEWVAIPQGMIDAFAELTEDRQWIHVDVDRARAEMPGGRTIAHGWLLLSLLPRLSAGFYKVRNASRSVNLGADKIRFLTPVKSGDRICLEQSIKSVTSVDGGVRIAFDTIIHVEGAARPAVVAETLRITYAR